MTEYNGGKNVCVRSLGGDYSPKEKNVLNKCKGSFKLS